MYVGFRCIHCGMESSSDKFNSIRDITGSQISFLKRLSRFESSRNHTTKVDFDFYDIFEKKTILPQSNHYLLTL